MIAAVSTPLFGTQSRVAEIGSSPSNVTGLREVANASCISEHKHIVFSAQAASRVVNDGMPWAPWMIIRPANLASDAGEQPAYGASKVNP